MPLSQFATFEYGQEYPLVWRRDRTPTLTVQADVAPGVLPETVVQFAGQPTLLRAVASLPPGEQRRLVEGETVEVAEKVGDTYTHRKLAVGSLPARLVRQVFGDRTIRTVGEQIALLSASTPRPPKPGRPHKHGLLRADRTKGVILLGRRPIQPADLIAALGDLRGTSDEEPGEDASTVVVKLTPAEHQQLRVRVATAGSSQQTLVRNALRAAGLI